MSVIAALAPDRRLVSAACAAVGVARASVHRHRVRLAGRDPAPRPRPCPPRGLAAQERQTVLALLREPRFVDLAPAEVYATLLDEGVYHCSIRTMYRLLAEHDEVRDRRDQSSAIRSTGSPSCWPRPPTKSGPGTSPS